MSVDVSHCAQRFLIVLSLILLLAVPSAFASQTHGFGFSFVSVPSFRTGIGAALEYVSGPEYEDEVPKVNMAYCARSDFAVSGFDVDGFMMSLMGGVGAAIHANDRLSVTLYAGPSFIFFIGNGKEGSVASDTG